MSFFTGFSRHVRCPRASKPPVTMVLALKPWAVKSLFRQHSVRDLGSLITSVASQGMF